MTINPTVCAARTTAKAAAASSRERRLKPRYHPISRARPEARAITQASVDRRDGRPPPQDLPSRGAPGHPRPAYRRTLRGARHPSSRRERSGSRRSASVTATGGANVAWRYAFRRSEGRSATSSRSTRSVTSSERASGRRLEREEAAWRFAFAEALVHPTDVTRRRIGKRLRSYVTWAELRSNRRRPRRSRPRSHRSGGFSTGWRPDTGRESLLPYEVLTRSRQFPDADRVNKGDIQSGLAIEDQRTRPR